MVSTLAAGADTFSDSPCLGHVETEPGRLDGPLARRRQDLAPSTGMSPGATHRAES